MEDADSDSGFDSDGDWYHAGRDIVYGLRTNSHAVGPDGAHRRRFLCGEEKKGGTRWGCLSFQCTIGSVLRQAKCGVAIRCALATKTMDASNPDTTYSMG